jgi:uncharacterized protein
MSRFLSWLVLLAVVLGSMAGSALAAAPSITDDAGLFSDKALENAREEIRRIERRYKRDFVVETYTAIPEGMKKDYSPAVVDRFFEEWARDRASRRHVLGIYLLICKEPAHFQVVVSKRVKNRVFSPEDRKELEHRLRQDLWSHPDQALVEAATFVESALHNNLGYQTTPRSDDDGTDSWLWVVYTTVLVLLGIWLVLGLTRALISPRPAGSSGTFLGSLLGGLFGAAAGMWIYDSVFTSPAPAGEPAADTDAGGEGDGDF